MIRIEIPEVLFATSRPGYDYGANATVSPELVSRWIAEVESMGAKSIICLLNEQHLKLYGGLPAGLLQAYRDAGFEVGHVPVVDHQRPPLSGSELKSVEQYFNELPKPVLIHCSAGVDRTGAAVRHLKTLSRIEQPQRSNPRLVQIHAGILIGSDAFESGIHEAHELEAAE
jgi:protein tyrosine phosphatase (PTP) superfamily phosphohydrolase (DUF442 family)